MEMPFSAVTLTSIVFNPTFSGNAALATPLEAAEKLPPLIAISMVAVSKLLGVRIGVTVTDETEFTTLVV